MTDEPREETPDEDVEGHGGIPGPLPEKQLLDESDDFEAHGAIPGPLPQPPLP